MSLLTLKFHDVFVYSCSTVATEKENKGPLKDCFDYVYKDRYASKKTFEQGEIEFCKKSIDICLKKARLPLERIDISFGSDLSNQLSLTSQVGMKLPSSFIGVYSACSSLILSMILSSILVSNKEANNALVFSSSSYGTSERQFRYPLEYGLFKRKGTTITTSGACSCIISSLRSRIRVSSCTIGKIEETNHLDCSDLGSPMAYSCYVTLKEHFKNTNTKPEDYSLIVTGDLSKYGSKILLELFKKDGIFLKNHLDGGSIIYSPNDVKAFMGGSGTSCIGLVGFSYIFKLMLKNELKNVLFVGTGALFSSQSVNQKLTIPTVSHVLELENII